MLGKEYKAVKKKDKVCEPASSQRYFWECKNRDTCFVLQKDFSKSPLKISGLLTPKFPSGLGSPLRLALQPASPNVPREGWRYWCSERPSGLLFAVLIAIRG